MNYFLGGGTVFALFILISLLFQKWHLFNNDRSLAAIIIQALSVSIVYSLIMFFYSRRQLKKRQADKN